MYDLQIRPEADRIFEKLSKKSPKQLKAVYNKIRSIISNPYKRFKSLKKPLNSFNRVHINSHFVLIFRINHKKTSVDIFYYDHHDNVYKWRPGRDQT